MEVNKVSANKCNDGYLSEIAVLRNENLADFLLIIPFLKHNWKKQFEMCEELLMKEMEIEMRNLSESRRRQMRESQKDITNANNGSGLERKFLAAPVGKGFFSFIKPRLQANIERIQDKQT